MIKYFKYRNFFVIILLLVTTLVFGQMSNYKSLYLYNFIKRIEWPQEEQGHDFVIVVLGDNSTADAMGQIAITKHAGDRTIKVYSFDDPDEIIAANLIYVDYSKRKYIAEINEWIMDQPILLVSDYKNAELTDINLLETSDGLEFILRPEKIRTKGLNLSDMLILLGRQDE